MATLEKVEGGLQYMYEEPSINKSGKPITDLDHTSIFVQVDDGEVTKLRDVPATAATGGGHISELIPNPVSEAAEGLVKVFSTATDDDGGEGDAGGQAQLSVDNDPPGPTL